jgi:hypothetical protein
MNATELMAKLVEIERAVDSAGLSRVHALALDAQEGVLQMEQQMMETLIENQRLLEYLEDGALDPEHLAELVDTHDDAAHSQFSTHLTAERARRKNRPFWIN